MSWSPTSPGRCASAPPGTKPRRSTCAGRIRRSWRSWFSERLSDDKRRRNTSGHGGVHLMTPGGVYATLYGGPDMKRYRRALALIFMMFVLAACGSAESPSAAAPTAPAPSLGAPPVAAVAATDTPSIPSPQPAPTSSDAPAPAQTAAIIVPTSVV